MNQVLKYKLMIIIRIPPPRDLKGLVLELLHPQARVPSVGFICCCFFFSLCLVGISSFAAVFYTSRGGTDCSSSPSSILFVFFVLFYYFFFFFKKYNLCEFLKKIICYGVGP
uniref:Uncharacterized protein n=1 Tax=Opuntia streptacantha TaxID=393608 RepID=A0A7C9DB31_OPUST